MKISSNWLLCEEAAVLLLFIETLDRLLVGEAVKDRSGDETDAVVAVEDVEFIFLTEIDPRLVGIPDNRLIGGGVISIWPFDSAVDMSNVLFAVKRWPIFARDKGSLKRY